MPDATTAEPSGASADVSAVPPVAATPDPSSTAEGDGSDAASHVPDSPRTENVLTALAVLVPFVFFFLAPPLSSSGLWDPHELNVADLARRIGVNIFGASALALSGADNSLPHLNDLGRPELPFTSVALGFKLFGLHEWAGRIPLATWGLAGVVATYGFVSRIFDKRAGLYAALVLTTMPSYFVQARTILGDVVAMSAFAMAFGGLLVATFDKDDDGPTSFGRRLPWLALGALGLVSGFYSRGFLLGVAVPAGAVGLSWVVTLVATDAAPLWPILGIGWIVRMVTAPSDGSEGAGARRDRSGDLVGRTSLGLGILGLFLAMSALETGSKSNLNMFLGAMAKTPSKYPTFDVAIGHLGHSLAPWSALVPVGVGRLFIAPKGVEGPRFDRESAGRAALLLGASVAFVAYGFVASHTEFFVFLAPAVLAAICGVTIRDFERGAHASVAFGVIAGVFLGLFHHDFHEMPEKAYQPFGIANATFPEGFKDRALLLWTVVLVGVAGLAFLTWVERDSKREPFDPKRYKSMLDSLRTAWDGLLALGYFAVVAGASCAAAVLFVGLQTKAKWLPTLSLPIRDAILNAWWATAVVPIAVIFGIAFACDLWIWTTARARPFSAASFTRGFEPIEDLFARLRSPDFAAERGVVAVILLPLMLLAVPGITFGILVKAGTKPAISAAFAVPSGVVTFILLGALGDLLRGSRAALFALAGTVGGAVLSVGYYPALANQLSPKEVFETYQKVRTGNEPLGLLGVGSRSAAYYAGGEPPSFVDARPAYDWLMGGGGARRFLVVKSEELPKLNSFFRNDAQPKANLPVIDARSSQILLVASDLAGSANRNPLDKVVLAAVPHLQHKLDVNMDDKLMVLGFDLIDASGKSVDVVAPGRKYRMKTVYKVLAPVGSEWEAFIHIDGFKKRHNGDHKPVNGKYPMTLWQKDDIVMDDHEFALEPNFTPGNYSIFFGLFVGESRMKVKSGPSDGDNRVNGGTLRVQ
ncbi:MAG: glycosyltransferase family 39 protein [Polyangiaceae bacterium]